jgi:hypothetical protein
MARGDAPSKKKPPYPVGKKLQRYLQKYDREKQIPFQYDDLLRFTTSMPLLNMEGEDTLWETVFYSESDTKELERALTYVYALLKTDGEMGVMEHLTVARIDFCLFGNTNPFRVRIINRLNDNYDHFYVKRADASRVYGLELEHVLSPNRITYLVDGHTLVEEHIAGIPGDVFFEKNLNESAFNQIRIAKEFVKFNERCFVRLLGDMRAYNYVVDITPDIEGSQYRIRAIDFDQQSYEGRKSFYMPQFFKENNAIIFLGIKHMKPETVQQYQLEERSLMARRVKASKERLGDMFKVMIRENISEPRKVEQLSAELAAHHANDDFLKCRTMGELVLAHLQLMLRKDYRQNILTDHQP